MSDGFNFIDGDADSDENAQEFILDTGGDVFQPDDVFAGEQDNGENIEAAEEKPEKIRKPFKPPAFLRGFTLKRALLSLSVMLACAAVGFFSMFIYSIVINNAAETEASEEIEEAHIAPVNLFSLGDTILRIEELRRQGDFFTNPADTQEQAQQDEGVIGISVVGLLYPDRLTSDQDANISFLSGLAERLALRAEERNAYAAAGTNAEAGTNTDQSAGGSDSLAAGGAPAHGSVAGGASTGGTPTGGTTAGGTSAGSAKKPVIPSNPTIAVESPFLLNDVSFHAVDDKLIHGRLSLTNRSGLTIENIFFELTLDYAYPGGVEQIRQFAYVKNANLNPGDEKSLSYATVPPLTGETPYTLKNIAVAAFDTHVNGVPQKVFYDAERSQLEILDA